MATLLCPAPAPASAPASAPPAALPSPRPSSPLPLCTPLPRASSPPRSLARECLLWRSGRLVGVTVRGCCVSDLSQPCPVWVCFICCPVLYEWTDHTINADGWPRAVHRARYDRTLPPHPHETLTIHHAPGTRGLRAIWLCEELGVPYRVEPVDFSVPRATPEWRRMRGQFPS